MAKILIIEDNRANMKLACLLLRSAGHSALCAVDAETGLTMARSEQPDLILMDIQLPGMDGLTATTLLKKDPATWAIPIIALTVMAMKADQDRAREAGCDGYIAKPLRYQELFAAMDTHLVNPGSRLPGGTQGHDDALRAGRLILVAEDNPASQKLILRQLALLGFAADVAGNGKIALDYWRNGNYALLLSDVHMPEMDGYELTAAIRAEENGLLRIPIVALTASSVEEGSIERPLEGMDDFLRKPLTLSKLKSTLDTWLPVPMQLETLAEAGAAPVDGAQSLDISVLESLVGKDPVVVLELLGDFRRSSSRIAPELIRACADGQVLEARQQAHKLMASARTVGALPLGDLCEKIESASKAGAADQLVALLPGFVRELNAVNTLLDQLRAQSAEP